MPSQDPTRRKINHLKSVTVSLTSLKDSGFTTPKNKKELEDSKNKLNLAKEKLKNLISDSQKQQNCRSEKKQMKT